MSATVKHLHRHIAAREQAIQSRLEAAAAQPKNKQHKVAADKLATEVSALRATVDYQKSDTALTSDIERQQVKVEYLLEALKKAKGLQKRKIERVLKHENQRLREMLAAAKLKAVAATTVLPAISLLPEATPAATEAAVAAATAEKPAVRLFPDDPRDPYIHSYRSHERFWSKIPGMEESYSGAIDGDADPWYKNPLVLILVGGVVGWYAAKKV